MHKRIVLCFFSYIIIYLFLREVDVLFFGVLISRMVIIGVIVSNGR